MNKGVDSENSDFKLFDIPLNRESYLNTIVNSLSSLLESVIGLEEASGFISTVGQKIGDEINSYYRKAVGGKLSKKQVIQALIDFKQRIQSDFFIVEETDNLVVFGCKNCPYNNKASKSKSLCMMTSSIFGIIVAENLGYAKIELKETMADNCSECRIVIYFDISIDSTISKGREFFKSGK